MPSRPSIRRDGGVRDHPLPRRGLVTHEIGGRLGRAADRFAAVVPEALGIGVLFAPAAIKKTYFSVVQHVLLTWIPRGESDRHRLETVFRKKQHSRAMKKFTRNWVCANVYLSGRT
jgi:hypothetical protein